MQRLFGGVSDDRRLLMQLLLWQLLHDGPHGSLRSQRNAAESLGLTVGPVLVKLDLEEIIDSQRLDGVLDVLIGGPPGQIAHVQLIALGRDGHAAHAGWGYRFGILFLFVFDVGIGSGRGQDVVVKIIGFLIQILLFEFFDVGVEVNVDAGVTHFCGFGARRDLINAQILCNNLLKQSFSFFLLIFTRQNKNDGGCERCDQKKSTKKRPKQIYGSENKK